MINLDNAATTLHKPKEVQEAVIAAFGQMGNSGRGASEPALKALGTVYDAREALARLFHAENASEIVFTANSTEALNIVIKGILDPGDHVITTVLEHNSVLRPLYECRRKGAEMTILTCDEYANISYEEMEKAVRKNTRAIICTHASNMTGNMISLESVGKIAAKYGILFIVDASQTAGVWNSIASLQKISEMEELFRLMRLTDMVLFRQSAKWHSEIKWVYVLKAVWIKMRFLLLHLAISSQRLKQTRLKSLWENIL